MATRSIQADVAQQMFDVWNEIRKASIRRFAEDGLSMPRAKALWALADDGPMRASALAQFLDCSAATVTDLVDGLEREGYAARGPDPSDRRAVLVSITPAGREVARTSRARKKRLLAEVFSVLTPAEARQLNKLLDRLADSPILNGDSQ